MTKQFVLFLDILFPLGAQTELLVTLIRGNNKSLVVSNQKSLRFGEQSFKHDFHFDLCFNNSV